MYSSCRGTRFGEDLGHPVHADGEQHTGPGEPEDPAGRGMEMNPARDRDGDQHADLQRGDLGG
jgi:hypothetical protein